MNAEALRCARRRVGARGQHRGDGAGPGRRPGRARRQGQVPARQGVRRPGGPARCPVAHRPRHRDSRGARSRRHDRRRTDRTTGSTPVPSPAAPIPAMPSHCLASISTPCFTRPRLAPAPKPSWTVRPNRSGATTDSRVSRCRPEPNFVPTSSSEPTAPRAASPPPADLIDPARVLWGFAVRGYVDEHVDLPHIVLWERTPWRAFPGYGWMFPGPDGRANLGLGLGTLATREHAATAAPRAAHVRAHAPRARAPRGRGTGARPRRLAQAGHGGNEPRAGRVLLVGDAAGLVNPLQGEGISQAMRSGRAAAEAALADPARAARALPRVPREHLRAVSLDDRACARGALVAAAPSCLGGRSHAHGACVRTHSLAAGWSIFWNDLLDGAQPTVPRAVAALAANLGRTATAGGHMRKWFTATLGEGSDRAAKSGSPRHERVGATPLAESESSEEF